MLLLLLLLVLPSPHVSLIGWPCCHLSLYMSPPTLPPQSRVVCLCDRHFVCPSGLVNNMLGQQGAVAGCPTSENILRFFTSWLEIGGAGFSCVLVSTLVTRHFSFVVGANCSEIFICCMHCDFGFQDMAGTTFGLPVGFKML